MFYLLCKLLKSRGIPIDFEKNPHFSNKKFTTKNVHLQEVTKEKNKAPIIVRARRVRLYFLS